ncbi:hypothetical protein PM082_002375 [Marasmius tenuissimus]|nr:hypothetical protein PM082_002375 [Marasmius tenuissimus]
MRTVGFKPGFGWLDPDVEQRWAGLQPNGVDQIGRDGHETLIKNIQPPSEIVNSL